MGTKGWRVYGVHGVCILTCLTKFQSKSAALGCGFFSAFPPHFSHMWMCILYTDTTPESQTESSSSSTFRQQRFCHQERIQSEDTTVLCSCFRNFLQFINTKHNPFSACSFSKFRYFPYLAQKDKNQNFKCWRGFFIPKTQELIFNRPVKIKLS